jgi:adenylyl-sulfate kinase
VPSASVQPQTSFPPVTREEREQRRPHRGAVVWLTGLSGAGKSTLAGALERVLFDLDYRVIVLDGDALRTGLNADLGFSMNDRVENIRRIGEVAALFADAGFIVITAAISPYAADRQRARRRVTTPFIEVFVDAPLEVCESRDPKGLYRKARSGEIPRFTGVSDPYEPPANPEMTIKTAERSLAECVEQVLERIVPDCRPTIASGRRTPLARPAASARIRRTLPAAMASRTAQAPSARLRQ